MPSFRSFHEGVVERAKTDADFRRSLLRECVDGLLNREFDVSYRLAKDYIRSVGFVDKLADELELDGGVDGVVSLFDPEVNIEGNKLLLALLIMLQNEGLSLTTRRQLSLQRQRLS